MNEETYKRTDLVHVRWELDESVARAEERARIVVKLRNLGYDAGAGSPEGMALDDAADQLDAEAMEQARAEERARIVALLREMADDAGPDPTTGFERSAHGAIWNAIDVIEGEFRFPAAGGIKDARSA